MMNIPSKSFEKLITRLKKTKIIIWLFILFDLGFFAFVAFKGYFVLAGILAFAAFGYIVWIGEILSSRFSYKLIKEMLLAYNWSAVSKKEKNSWDIIDYLETEHIPLISCNFRSADADFIVRGNFCKRDFRFGIISARYGKNDKEKFLLTETTPLANFDNVILITLKEEDDEEEYSDMPLKNTQIDTQGFFDIYAKNPQNIADILPRDFIDALINYVKTTEEACSLLIIPQGIFITKRLEPASEPSLCFSRADKYVYEYWQSTENFLKLLEVINLLEKK